MESLKETLGEGVLLKSKTISLERDLKSAPEKAHLSKTMSPTENRTSHIMRQTIIRELKIISGVFCQEFKRPFSPQTSTEYPLCIHHRAGSWELGAGSMRGWRNISATLFPEDIKGAA